MMETCNILLVFRKIIKDKYKEAFEIDPLWMIKITAARGKWIDQSQSHNVFMQGVSGKKLHDIYMAAWRAWSKNNLLFTYTWRKSDRKIDT